MTKDEEIKTLNAKVDKYLNESLFYKSRCIQLNEELERYTSLNLANTNLVVSHRKEVSK